MKACITYLSLDSVERGVGASQVVPYVVRLADSGLSLRLHSFESDDRRDPAVADVLAASGVTWTAHRFGRPGVAGGAWRVLRAAIALRRRSAVVHARSDLAAASAWIARSRPFVWDMRSFWTDERLAAGSLKRGSLEERTLRALEARSARSSAAIVVLAKAAIPVLADRHGASIVEKCHVIPTCVDLDRFAATPMPATKPLVLALSGSLNRHYDVELMLEFVKACMRRIEVELRVFTPMPTEWDAMLTSAGAVIEHHVPWAIPAKLRGTHAGLSAWRADTGVSLRAAMPTKIGEFLATGRPVVVNRELGDMDDIIRNHRCGVILDSHSSSDLDRRAADLIELLSDPDTARRCRAAAETHFDVRRGAEMLEAIYSAVGTPNQRRRAVRGPRRTS